MTEKIARPVKFIRFSENVLYLLPRCYCSFPDSVDKRDCKLCPVAVECQAKKPPINRDHGQNADIVENGLP